MTYVRPEIASLASSPIVDVWKLGFEHPGTIGLWAGESDMPTPDFICEAASRGLAAGRTFYAQSRGTPELRQALRAYYRRHHGTDIADGRLAVTCSGMNAVMVAVQALVGAGDNVVAITPSWPNILRAIEIMGGQVRGVAMHGMPDGWHLDLDAVFAACDARTRAIYYASPGNPTGWMLEAGQAQALLDFARARGIALLADEVYQRIVYDRPVAASILEIAAPDDPVWVVNTFSKAWAMTGWRLGWLVAPSGLEQVLENLLQYNTSGAQAFLQDAAVVALEQGDPFVAAFVARCRDGWHMVSDRLANMPRVRLVPNAASFYVMFSVDGVSDTLEFCKRAVTEAGVGLAPGIAFAGGADDCIRLCYARGTETLDTAMTRLQGFVRDYRAG